MFDGVGNSAKLPLMVAAFEFYLCGNGIAAQF
jgi:hypothetical protein